jgi:hypothetical protein
MLQQGAEMLQHLPQQFPGFMLQKSPDFTGRIWGSY